MDLDRFNAQLKRLQSADSRGSARPEFNKIATLQRRRARAALTRQKDLNGSSWPEMKNRRYRVGQVAPIGRDKRPGAMQGRIVIRRLNTSTDVRKANRFTFGGKKVKAIYRKEAKHGRRKAVRLAESFLKKSASGNLNYIGAKGAKIGSRWQGLANVQQNKFGRPFWYVDQEQIKAAEKILLEGEMKRIAKALR